MLKLLILLTLASSLYADGTWGPFDPRCPAVDDSQNPWHLPHESECTKFYKCFDRQRVLFSCAPGTEWGHMEICIGIWCACEWPWTAQCNPANLPPLPSPTEYPTTPSITTPMTTPPTTTLIPTSPSPPVTTPIPTSPSPPITTPTPTPSPTHCPEVDDPSNPVFLPHEIFCDQYYVCHRGAKLPRSCAFGLFWDQANKWCDFPGHVQCHHDCPTPDDIDNPIFLPNYSYCDRYFLCFNGTRIPRNCAPGLQWSRNGEWCDYYDIIRCQSTILNQKVQAIGDDEMARFRFDGEL